MKLFWLVLGVGAAGAAVAALLAPETSFAGWSFVVAAGAAAAIAPRRILVAALVVTATFLLASLARGASDLLYDLQWGLALAGLGSVFGALVGLAPKLMRY